ncbi:hypothetical protein DM860_004503 [Cuscuta australis]|uniref:Uncharacterized protein n=1 Tax=Cuscuta australis TaxID=267555 RepID=A0A328E7Y9_9ASTE|nr:hypothetical protein DM860_004503 [Cuscuta australis]
MSSGRRLLTTSDQTDTSSWLSLWIVGFTIVLSILLIIVIGWLLRRGRKAGTSPSAVANRPPARRTAAAAAAALPDAVPAAPLAANPLDAATSTSAAPAATIATSISAAPATPSSTTAAAATTSTSAAPATSSSTTAAAATTSTSAAPATPSSTTAAAATTSTSAAQPRSESVVGDHLQVTIGSDGGLDAPPVGDARVGKAGAVVAASPPPHQPPHLPLHRYRRAWSVPLTLLVAMRWVGCHIVAMHSIRDASDLASFAPSVPSSPMPTTVLTSSLVPLGGLARMVGRCYTRCLETSQIIAEYD